MGNPKLIEILEMIRAPFSINTLAQAAAIEALRDKRYLRKVVTKVRKGRAYLCCVISNLGMRVLPSDANFLMVDVSPLKTDASQICEFLAKRNILIRNLSNFRGVGTRWVRITVGTRPQNEKLVQTLKKFKGGRK
ncbi:Histidinol-phosphate aminotransferase [subsurface metagenome]